MSSKGFNLTQTKSILQSTTFWGAIIALLGTVAPHIYANLFGSASQTVVVSGIVSVVGFIITVYGRFTAKQVVTLTGGPTPPAKTASGTEG